MQLLAWTSTSASPMISSPCFMEYFAYVSTEGKVGKPFMLPQRTSDYYEDCMWSYNIPEFVSDKIDVSARAIMDEAGTSGVGIRFVK